MNTQMLNSWVQKALEEALDRVLERFAEDPTMLFESESHRSRELYRGVENRASRWSRPGECVVSGCSERSIRCSHTIQEAGPLRPASKSGKVLTPRRSMETGQIELELIGLSKASVFPGFCQVHEALFEGFERQGGLQIEEHVLLQLYRTACREQFRMEQSVRSLDELIKRYEEIASQGALRLLEAELGAEWMHSNGIDLKNISIKDGRVASARETLADTKLALVTVERLKCTLEQAVIRGSVDVEGCVALHIEDVALPVALSGLGSFHVRDAGIERCVLVLLGVFPDARSKSTMLTVYAQPSNSAAVDLYLSGFESALGLLNMVEQWMIRGTDHWFLHPDVWDEKRPAARRTVLNEIEDTSGIEVPLEFSIFDSVRRRWLMSVRHAGYVDLAEREKAKLERSF